MDGGFSCRILSYIWRSFKNVRQLIGNSPKLLHPWSILHLLKKSCRSRNHARHGAKASKVLVFVLSILPLPGGRRVERERIGFYFSLFGFGFGLKGGLLEDE